MSNEHEHEHVSPAFLERIAFPHPGDVVFDQDRIEYPSDKGPPYYGVLFSDGSGGPDRLRPVKSSGVVPPDIETAIIRKFQKHGRKSFLQRELDRVADGGSAI